MDLLHVAVAVIADSAGRILLAKRHDDAHQGGLWEFPGGKLDPGERLADALARECREELGIHVQAHRPLIQVRHDYADRRVLLDVHRVTAYQGEPQGMEGQPLAWATPAELLDYPMPAADVPIVNAIRLPDHYAITPSQIGDPHGFMAQLRGVLHRGTRLLQYRLARGEDREHRLAQDMLQACRSAGASLLVNGDIELARRLGAAGVHLKAAQLQSLDRRPAGLGWVAASCHDAADLAQASRLGVDFVVLSPVKETASHPGALPLGWTAFAGLVAEARLPVYALGGLDAGDLQDAWHAGAQGIAGIRGLWDMGER